MPGTGPDAVIDWVLRLREDLGIPNTLSELGVTDSQVEALAPMAALDPTAATNPVPMTVDSMALLYRRAIAGELGP